MTRRMLIFLTLVACATAWAEPPPISAFARRPITDVSLSPDGRYLLYLTSLDGRPAAVTVDRHSDHRRTPVIGAGTQSHFDFTWCGWANATRILCGYQGVVRADVLQRESRLIAVNADGSDKKTFENWSVDIPFFGGFAPTQDRIVDFNAGPRDKVLIQLLTEWGGYPGVIELDINTGHVRVRDEPQPPIREFVSDGSGNVRLAHGPREKQRVYYVRFQGERDLREWARAAAVPRGEELVPVQVIRDTNTAYARGTRNGRDALWIVDLEKKAPPQLIFAHPDVDAGELIFSRDRRLLGVAFETDRPSAHYIDQRAASLIAGANRFLPDAYNEIIDSSADGKIYVIRSRSDIDDGSYYVIDASSGTGELELLGTSYPELDRTQLGRMRSFNYPAGSGVSIPGYLTAPPGAELAKLPLVVMPHDGPDDRDRWQFDFLRHFLVSRGYAVLQVNYRGSRGYGVEWLEAANGDWGRLPTTDIRFGAGWAVAQGIDPARICILGRGFGGYAALLAAIRDGDRFRCAISIAGFGDLKDQATKGGSFAERGILRMRMGTDRRKLEFDSPVRYAARAAMPILLVHGTHDLAVSVDQSKRMAAALKRAGKPHELVIIDGAGHDLGRESDRSALLTSIERFLGANLK